MESKSKKFTRKLVAFFLAVVMALTCFSGTFTAFAKQGDAIHDDALIANFMEWADATDEQTMEVLLDKLDELLAGVNFTFSFSQSILVTTIAIDGHVDSVDGLFDLIAQFHDLLAGGIGSLAGGLNLIGDLENVDLSAIGNLSYSTTDYVISDCGKSYRAVNDAKVLIKALFQVLYENSNSWAGNNVLGAFFDGTLELGSIIEGAIGGNLYTMLGGAFGLEGDSWKSNAVYNIVANIIFNNTKWFTDEEVAAFRADMSTFNFDKELYSKLSSELLGKINVLVTYPKVGEAANSSATRRAEIEAYIEANGGTWETMYKEAAAACGYDPLLVYSEEPGFENNILLFTYDDETLVVDENTTLYDIALQAIKLAWNTVLKDTIDLLHVNYDVDRGHGSNFDNAYYYWAAESAEGPGWDKTNVAANYTEEKVMAWATAVYEAYSATSPEEFLEWVRNNFEHDRAVVDEPTYTWRDIEANKLFNQLRYSPLADMYFDMQTGPINLYFLQMGNTNIDNFFNDLAANNTYTSVLGGLNDALVAACKDIFVTSANGNIMYGDTAITAPTLATTGNVDVVNNQEAALATIVDTLASNALKVLEYAANAANMNILNGFYHNNGITYADGTYNLLESNLEEAMLPLLVSLIGQVYMLRNVHPETWDKAGNAEGVAIIALEEHLAYILPENDYSVLYTLDADGHFAISSTTIDIDKNGTIELLDVVSIMTRDALGFHLSAIAPLRDANGNPYSAYTVTVTDTTSPYDLINSLLVYYAEGYDGKNTAGGTYDDGTQGQGLAQLLGCVDSSGNSLVNLNNDLWTNINNIFNHLLPAIGVLTNGDDSGWGAADSYELLYEGIIQSFLNISDQKDTQYKYSGFTGEFGGVRNFLCGFGTVLSATPLTQTGIGITVYDYILCPLLNAIFGARYSGQAYEHVIPYSCYYDADSSSNTATATPFNSFLHVDALAGFNSTASGSGRTWTYTSTGDSVGMLGLLFSGIFEAFGGMSGSSYESLPGVDACWQGASFAAQAIATFIPNFLPSLREHSLKMTSAQVANASQSGLTSGSAFASTTVDIKNNSIGLNRYYETVDGAQIQDTRYFTSVTNIVVTDLDGNTVSNVNVGATTATIAPGETKSIALSGTTQSDATDKVYVINVTYDIFQGKMSGTTYPTKTADNTLYTGVETKAYLFLSTQKAWADTLYTRSGDPSNCRWYDAAYETDCEYVTQPSNGGTSKQLYAQIPKDCIVPMSNPSMINDFGLRVKNTSNSLFGSSRAYDGIFAYPGAGQDYQTITGYDANGDLVTDAGGTLDAVYESVGYAAIDRTTGDILNYAYKDYSTDDGATWVYNGTNASNGHIGFTDDELSALDSSITGSEGFTTRTHVVYTLKEAYDLGLVSFVDRDAIGVDENGVTQYIYNAVFINNPTTALLEGGTGSISWGTSVPGIWLTGYKQTIEKAKSVYTRYIAYDGVTPLEAYTGTIYLNVYTSSNNNMKAPLNLYVVNDVAANTLRDKYSSMLKTMSQYQVSDFANASSYTNMQVALGEALAALSTPINTSNATSFGSVQLSESKVVDSWTIFGDPAYQPYPSSEALPGSVAVGATAKDGYWYYNDECTMPIYKNVAVTASTGATSTMEWDGKTYTIGTDVQGTQIIQGEDGNWYLLNLPKYETAWDTTTYSAPYRYETTTQVGSDTGELVYEAISFVYRDANGDKCTSKDEWKVKLPETNVTVKPNDGNEYRGIYQREVDKLDYYYEIALEDLDSAAVIDLLLENVIEARKGMNNVNHHVQSYENMVKVAKAAEAMLITTWVETDEIEVDAEGNPVIDDATGEPVHVWEPEYSTNYSSIQVREAVRVFEEYFNNRVIDRNYIGDKLEAEIICATKYDYTVFNYTSEEREVIDEVTGEAVVDEETGEVVTETIYTSVVADPSLGDVDGTPVKYGAVVGGEIVNEGEIVYTEESWDNYIHALGAAVAVADLGNADTTDYDARVSASYTARYNLMVAENELEEALPETSDLTISGTIAVAADLTGDAYSGGLIGINVTLADGTVVATSAADGTFTATVPAGTTELIITGPSTIDRTVTLAGDANVEGAIIPVVMADYNRDGNVTGADTADYAVSLAGTFNVYCDFNCDGQVTGADTAEYAKYIGQTIVYTAMTIA